MCQKMDFSCHHCSYFPIKCLGRRAFPMFPLPLRFEELWLCDACLVYALRAEDPGSLNVLGWLASLAAVMALQNDL